MPTSAVITLTTLGAGAVLLVFAAVVVYVLGRLTSRPTEVPDHTRHTPAARRRTKQSGISGLDAIQRGHTLGLPFTQASGVRRRPGAASTRTQTRTPFPALTREAR